MTAGKPPLPAVLVVDDEALIRWSLSEALAEAGHTVIAAATGAEVRRALLRDPRPIVVVLDLRLPDVRDHSLLEEIQRLRPDAPIIVMTAHGTESDAERVHALGADFVTKPFDLADMVALVSRAWDARH
jgi:two-component system nitrogen regulation response regulator GlnG